MVVRLSCMLCLPVAPTGCPTEPHPNTQFPHPYIPKKVFSMTRVLNFSAGPATLPETVLRHAAAEMLDWKGSGMSVMEMSHRGK